MRQEERQVKEETVPGSRCLSFIETRRERGYIHGIEFQDLKWSAIEHCMLTSFALRCVLIIEFRTPYLL